MSNSKTTPPRADWFQMAGLILLGLYAAFLVRESNSVAGGSDSAGYLICARMLSEGRLTEPIRTIPELPPSNVWDYTPLGMIARGDPPALRPTYPVGLPLHFAAAARLTGWDVGPILVNVLAALGVVLLTRGCIIQLGVNPRTATTASAALAASCILIFTSIQPFSDTLAAAWCTTAFYCALRARSSTRWSLACGAATAMAVLVRPVDVLVVPALVLVLSDWRRVLGAFACGLPGAVFLAWYNHVQFGSATTSGYGDVLQYLSPKWLAPTASMYVTWIPRALPVGVLAFLLVPWLPWRRAWREMTALCLWFAGFAGFFAFYPVTHESVWGLRFVLPAFPAVAIMAAVGWERVCTRTEFLRRPLAGAMMAALTILLTLLFTHRTFRAFDIYRFAENAKPYREFGRWADDHAPPESAFAAFDASAALYYYTRFPIIRPDLIEPAREDLLLTNITASGRPLFLFTYDFVEPPPMLSRHRDDWTEIRKFGAFSLWHFTPNRTTSGGSQ